MARQISIALTGDVMLGRLVDAKLKRFGALYPWGNTLENLRAADLRIINLECVIARSGRPWSRWRKAFYFRADPIAIESLQEAHIDCVVLANNHVLDFEEEALLEMLGLLEKAGIRYAGAGRNLQDAGRPAMLETFGVRVAVLGFTDNEPGWAATANSPGTNYIPISLDEKSLKPVTEAIGRARAEGANLVIFSIHWGPNMVERPSKLFREFARAVIDAGADVYHGHSAHVFQGVEIYKRKPVIYDAGEFVDDYAVDPELRNDLGLLFRLQLTDSRIDQMELMPISIDDCQVNLAKGSTRDTIVRRIEALSAEMGTHIRSDDNRLLIECATVEPTAAPAKQAGGRQSTE
jgi:poly-gamma-glutamate synthesis protein (capsule biosynthesis protein)